MVEPILGAEPRHAVEVEREPDAGAQLAQGGGLKSGLRRSTSAPSKKRSKPPGEMISGIRQCCA